MASLIAEITGPNADYLIRYAESKGVPAFQCHLLLVHGLLGNNDYMCTWYNWGDDSTPNGLARIAADDISFRMRLWLR